MDKVELAVKEGDHVVYSDLRSNTGEPNAYFGMEGRATSITEDGSFAIVTPTSTLVIPMYKRRGIWLYVNRKFIFYTGARKISWWRLFYEWWLYNK